METARSKKAFPVKKDAIYFYPQTPFPLADYSQGISLPGKGGLDENLTMSFDAL